MQPVFVQDIFMDVPRFQPSHRQAGFTLVELIAIIVMLGILAATALPKFVALGSDARKAALGAARGSLEAVKTVAHGQSLIVGSLTAPVGVERFSVAMVNGYPSSGVATAAAAGLGAADWTITVSGRDLV